MNAHLGDGGGILQQPLVERHARRGVRQQLERAVRRFSEARLEQRQLVARSEAAVHVDQSAEVVRCETEQRHVGPVSCPFAQESKIGLIQAVAPDSEVQDLYVGVKVLQLRGPVVTIGHFIAVDERVPEGGHARHVGPGTRRVLAAAARAPRVAAVDRIRPVSAITPPQGRVQHQKAGRVPFEQHADPLGLLRQERAPSAESVT